ncbi:MAG: hypothetical protein JHC33_03585 [Ignisphaera sp.]|nr:hypothetical protein [Ignisphaera sp.]
MKCKTCGKNSDGEYCFQHKQRKPLAQSRLKPTLTPKKGVLVGKSLQKSSLLPQKLDKSPSKFLEMRQFFLSVWNKRPHRSEVSGVYLGSEALSTYFHHILPKSKYPEACLDEENIILLTFIEHQQVESDIYRYEEVNKRREQLKIKYNL